MIQEDRFLGLKLFLTCWIVYAMHFATDISREHYPAFSLAERGTLRVDPYLGLHSDIFEIEGRGAFINNNPGASLVGAIPYAIFRPLVDRVVARVMASRAAHGQELDQVYNDPRTARRRFFRLARERGLDVRFGLAAGLIQLFGFAPLTAGVVLIMRSLLVRLGVNATRSVWLALLYGFGTPIFFRSAYLNHNLLVAHTTLAAFALLFVPGSIERRPGRLFAAGLAAGYGLLCDYAGVVPLVALGLCPGISRQCDAERDEGTDCQQEISSFHHIGFLMSICYIRWHSMHKIPGSLSRYLLSAPFADGLSSAMTFFSWGL